MANKVINSALLALPFAVVAWTANAKDICQFKFGPEDFVKVQTPRGDPRLFDVGKVIKGQGYPDGLGHCYNIGYDVQDLNTGKPLYAVPAQLVHAPVEFGISTAANKVYAANPPGNTSLLGLFSTRGSGLPAPTPVNEFNVSPVVSSIYPTSVKYGSLLGVSRPGVR